MGFWGKGFEFRALGSGGWGFGYCGLEATASNRSPAVLSGTSRCKTFFILWDRFVGCTKVCEFQVKGIGIWLVCFGVQGLQGWKATQVTCGAGVAALVAYGGYRFAQKEPLDYCMGFLALGPPY